MARIRVGQSIAMIAGIVQSADAVTLLGGAPARPRTLDLCLSMAPVLVAADGAAAVALAAGHLPDAVIGDFDSLDDDTRARLPAERLHQIDDQLTTDFDKALRNISAPLVLAAGFMGARLDHELAVYNALVRLRDRRCIVVGEHDICFHAPPELAISLTPGARVSLFPMARVTGESTGLRWPIGGLAFAPDGMVGTSNEAVEAEITLRMHGPGMLVILPRQALEAAVRALAPPAHG